MPTSSEIWMMDSDSKAFDIRALAKVESEEMLEANTEESVGDADAINLVVLPRKPRMEETAVVDMEETGPTETQQPPPPPLPILLLHHLFHIIQRGDSDYYYYYYCEDDAPLPRILSICYIHIQGICGCELRGGGWIITSFSSYFFFKFLVSAPMPLELGMVELDLEAETFDVLALKDMEEEA